MDFLIIPRWHDPDHQTQMTTLSLQEENQQLKMELAKIKGSRFYFPGDTEEEQGDQLYSFLTNDADSGGVWTHEEQLGKMVDEYEKTIAELNATIATLRTTSIKDLVASKPSHDEEEYLVDQDDFKTDNLYWGANCGHVRVWRLPENLTIPDDMDFGDVFGNSRCLGEEWGGLNSVCIKTVTQEMIDAERFE